MSVQEAERPTGRGLVSICTLCIGTNMSSVQASAQCGYIDNRRVMGVNQSHFKVSDDFLAILPLCSEDVQPHVTSVTCQFLLHLL